MGPGDDCASLNRLLARPMRRWWLRVGVWGLLLQGLVQAANALLRLTGSGMPFSNLTGSVPLLSSDVLSHSLWALSALLWMLWLLAACHCYRLSIGTLTQAGAPVPARLVERCFWICLAQGMLPMALAYAVWFAEEGAAYWAGVHNAAAAGSASSVDSVLTSWPGLVSLIAIGVMAAAGYMAWLIALLLLTGRSLPSWLWGLSQPAAFALRPLMHTLPIIEIPDRLGSLFIAYILPYAVVVGILLLTALLISAVAQRPRLVMIFTWCIVATVLAQVVQLHVTTHPTGANPNVLTGYTFPVLMIQAYAGPPVSFRSPTPATQSRAAKGYRLETSWVFPSPSLPVGAWGVFVAVALNSLWLALQFAIVRWLIRLRYRQREAVPAAQPRPE